MWQVQKHFHISEFILQFLKFYIEGDWSKKLYLKKLIKFYQCETTGLKLP